MKTPSHGHIRDLVERISRIYASGEWTGGLNPSQHAALAYLAKANRFSRAPSHVAEFLSATRGTVSQTLKALARKQMIEEIRSQSDRRSISYILTSKGMAALEQSTAAEDTLEALSLSTRQTLSDGLEALIHTALRARGNKQFGQCLACRHHRKETAGSFCTLLKESLEPNEATQICHEFEDAA